MNSTEETGDGDVPTEVAKRSLTLIGVISLVLGVCGTVYYPMQFIVFDMSYCTHETIELGRIH